MSTPHTPRLNTVNRLEKLVQKVDTMKKTLASWSEVHDLQEQLLELKGKMYEAYCEIERLRRENSNIQAGICSYRNTARKLQRELFEAHKREDTLLHNMLISKEIP